MSEELNIDMPEDARRYIEIAKAEILPKGAHYVLMGGDEVVHFRNMTDEQAVRVARSIYFDIDLPTADKRPRAQEEPTNDR